MTTKITLLAHFFTDLSFLIVDFIQICISTIFYLLKQIFFDHLYRNTYNKEEKRKDCEKMPQLITAAIENPDLEKEIDALTENLSEELKALVKEAFLAGTNEDFEKGYALCQEILRREPGLTRVKSLYGQYCFAQKKLDEAKAVYEEVIKEDPESEMSFLYLGMICHIKGYYKQATKYLKRIYPPKQYMPFYYNIYGDSLLNLGQYKKSREIFYQEVLHYETTGIIPSDVMLDGSFQNLLYLDITLHHKQYAKDLASYYLFLEKIEMTDEMQECLAGTIVLFSTLQHFYYYRPLFLEFVTYIKEKNYLTGKYAITLDSAYTSWESYYMNDDVRVSPFAVQFFASQSGKQFPEKTSEEITEILSHQWFMCQYYPGHKEELAYIQENYPYNYVQTAEFLKKVDQNPDKMAQRILFNLANHLNFKNQDDLIPILNHTYAEALKGKKDTF